MSEAAIAAMLDDDAKASATVITARLRSQGLTGSLTILMDHLRLVRPTFAAVRAYHRTCAER